MCGTTERLSGPCVAPEFCFAISELMQLMHHASSSIYTYCIPRPVPCTYIRAPALRLRLPTCTSRILEGRSGAQVGLSCS